MLDVGSDQWVGVFLVHPVTAHRAEPEPPEGLPYLPGVTSDDLFFVFACASTVCRL